MNYAVFKVLSYQLTVHCSSSLIFYCSSKEHCFNLFETADQSYFITNYFILIDRTVFPGILNFKIFLFVMSCHQLECLT